jgi:hypothetical protein
MKRAKTREPRRLIQRSEKPVKISAKPSTGPAAMLSARSGRT